MLKTETFIPGKVSNKLGKKVLSEDDVDPITSSRTKATKNKLNWHNIIAGAAAGAASRLASAPLDIIKIRRQLDIEGNKQCRSTTGLLPSLQNVAKSEGGLRGLFRGNAAAMYLWITYGVVQFSLYEKATSFIAQFDSVNDRAENDFSPFSIAQNCLGQIASSAVATAFCAGGTAGVAATLSSFPFDTARTIFASKGITSSLPNLNSAPSAKPPKSLLDYTCTMFQKNGVGGLYAGVIPAVVQIIPYMGINFALYELLINHKSTEKKSSLSATLAGFISGGTSKILVYPLDTVKKRLQAQAFLQSNDVKYKGMIDCFIRIGKEEGFRSYYRGLVPTVLKSMIGTGVAFGVYNLSKNLTLKFDSKVEDQIR